MNVHVMGVLGGWELEGQGTWIGQCCVENMKDQEIPVVQAHEEPDVDIHLTGISHDCIIQVKC